MSQEAASAHIAHTSADSCGDAARPVCVTARTDWRVSTSKAATHSAGVAQPPSSATGEVLPSPIS